MKLSREQFRELLMEALEDPALARVAARKLGLPAYPVEGAACTSVTTSGGTAGYFPYFNTGAGCVVENSVVFQTSGGNVGIGTASPGYALHVYGSSGSDVVAGVQNGGIGRAVLRVDTGGTSTGDVRFYRSGTEKFALINVVSSGVDNFGVYDAAAAAWRIWVDSSGNVGINTTSPQAKLDVAGGINASGSVVIGGTATKQSSGGPEKVSFQDTSASKVCLANFVGTEQYARLLIDMQGNHEWAGPSDVDQNVLLGWVSLGMLNVQGLPQGGFEVVAWKNTTLSQAINNTTTTVYVNDTSPFSTTGPNNRVRVDNELMAVSAIDSGLKTLTVSRGDTPSTAAAHSSGATITALGVPEAQPRVLLKVDGSGILFTDGVNASDASISRPSASQIYIQGDALLAKSGGKVGFYGTSPISKPTVTGSRGGNAALASLLTALSQLGLIVDNSTA